MNNEQDRIISTFDTAEDKISELDNDNNYPKWNKDLEKNVNTSISDVGQ